LKIWILKYKEKTE